MNTFGGYSLYDPSLVIAARQKFNRPEIPELIKANSLYVPGGCEPAIGWILLRREDYDALDNWSATLQLQIEDFDKNSSSALTIKHLAIVQARCVTTGVISDKDALYLVQITDKRGVINSPWFSKPTNTQFNVRSPAYPGNYYVSTLTGSVSWSWSTMIQNLWEQIPLLGTWPTLPITPTGTPEDWLFTGISVWDALFSTLDHLGLTIAVDLTSDTPYTIVRKGNTDSAFSTLTTQYANWLLEDEEPLSLGSGRVPGTLIVYFHKRYDYYGSEETVRYDDKQWQVGHSIYSISVAAPSDFTGAQGTGYIWSDFTIRIDANGNPYDADIATAQTIAAERATQFFDRIYSSTLGAMKRTYSGTLPFKTGAQVDRITWKQLPHGWITIIERG